ncbi:MAG: HAMP domain-containing histidine kinase [Elusimicrobia bacterium]|nr:HAMP domain-containing histidine kinase [Elusimicrobiota bacterium]
MLILAVVGGVMSSLAVYEKSRLLSEMNREQKQDLEKLASVWKDTNITADEPALLKYASAVVTLSSPRVAYVGVRYKGNDWIYSLIQKPPFSYVNGDDPAIQQLRNVRAPQRRQARFMGLSVIELSNPVGSEDYVRLGYSQDVVDSLYRQAINRTFRRLGIVGLIAFFFGLILANLFSQALVKPIVSLMTASEAIAKGQKGVKVPEGSDDEIGKLVTTFNHMSDELAKLDELKDEFMAHVTHELRSPLTSIIATAELMGEMPAVTEDPKMKRQVERLMYGSVRLNKLVDNILDLMRMEAGKMPFDIQPIDIRQILIEMADFFEARAQEKKLYTKADVPPTFPLVMADPEKIRQVLSNLIYNAIKFTNEGGITLWVKETNGMAHIGVRDTGVGIPKDKLDSVFKKFETIKEVRDRVSKPVAGSGLGLNIVQNSIKAQGGRVWVESEMGQGSTFQFTLPLAAANAQAAPAAAEQQPHANGNSAPVMLSEFKKAV